MRENSTFIIVALVVLSVPLSAQESKPSQSQDQQRDGKADARADHSWTRALKHRSKRGTLHDVLQKVRGDSGKWSETARLQYAPPIGQKPADVLLDEWGDKLLEKKPKLTSDDDAWLLFRTRQLDDNDRLWVEQIERRGNRFTVVVNQAVWQGRYRKNFTYHNVLGVNLGKLEPGRYEAKWIIKPLAFDEFEKPGSPRNNWPKDERPAHKKPTVLPVAFAVVKNSR